MKKLLIIIGVSAAIIIAGILFIKDNPVEKIEKAINNQESFVLVISQSVCDVCDKYKKDTLDKYAKNPLIPLYILEVDINPNKEPDKAQEIENFLYKHRLLSTFDDEECALLTPTTYVVKNGVFTKWDRNCEIYVGKRGNISLAELYEYIEDCTSQF